MAHFTIHPRLAAGGHHLASVYDCDVLLKNNAHYLWFVIIPHVDSHKSEITHLSETEYKNINSSSLIVSQFLEYQFSPAKINIGNIGNIVRQMHIHVIGRSETDPAWPEVVWGNPEKIPYPDERVEEIRNDFAAFIAKNLET